MLRRSALCPPWTISTKQRGTVHTCTIVNAARRPPLRTVQLARKHTPPNIGTLGDTFSPCFSTVILSLGVNRIPHLQRRRACKNLTQTSSHKLADTIHTQHTPVWWTPAWRQLLRPIKVGRTSQRPAPEPRATIASVVSGIDPLILPVQLLLVLRLLLLLPRPRPRLPVTLPVVVLSWTTTKELVASRCTRSSNTNQFALVRALMCWTPAR